jgi:ubiquinone biosynthesis protein
MISSLRSIRHWHRYREIVTIFFRHGFGFAFDMLEPEWHSIRRAMKLPAREKYTTPSGDLAIHFRLALEELGPTFIKFGQILSTRPDLLPPAYIAELSKLHDNVPAAPWEIIREVLVRELGREPEDVFTTIDPQPMAVASLAQVHAAVLPGGCEVVVKVQRPGITAVIETDLEILSFLALRAQSTPLGKIYEFVAMADDFAFTLRNELDYCHEGRNADRFRQNFSGEACAHIPAIHWDFTTRCLLVMEYIHGIKVNDIEALDAAGYDRHQVALHSARVLIKEVLEDGFFHADPHPGNYNVMPGEVIGIMDFGMVGFLNARERLDLIRLYIMIVGLDANGIVDQLVRMGAASADVDRSGLARDMGRLLNKYYAISLKGLHARDVIEELRPVVFNHHLHLPGNLWQLGKTLAMLEGLGMQLDPDFDLFEVAQPFVRHLTRRLVMPDEGWGRSALIGGANWGELIDRLPRAGNRVLERIERNEPLQLSLKDTDRIISNLDRLLTRLSLCILIGCLIIGLAFLIPGTSPNGWVQLLIVGGLIAVLGLGIWLFFSLLRSWR